MRIFLNRRYWPIFAGLVFSVAAFALRADSLPATQALLTLAITWAGAVPGLWYLYQPAVERPPIPLMGLTGIFYGIFFK